MTPPLAPPSTAGSSRAPCGGALLALGKAGDLAPAAHLRGLVGSGSARAWQARRAGQRRGGGCREEPGLRGLELLDVVVVVCEKGAGGLDVARPRELELEAHALLVAAPAQLVHLRAQLLGALGGLRGLRDLALELGDASVALGERRLVVLVRLSDDVAAVICVACCCAAWSPRACGSPATCACVAAPSFPSPMRGPAFLLGRAKKMPASFPIRASSRLVTNRCMTKARTFKPILLFPWELILLFAV